MPDSRAHTRPFDDGHDPSDPTTAEMPYAKVDIPRLERAVREILLAVGEHPDREGLLRTPARVARPYAELFAGLVGIGADVSDEDTILTPSMRFADVAFSGA